MSKNKQMPGLITGLVALLAVAAFFLLGFFAKEWTRAWIVFLAIPLAAILAEFIFKKKNKLDTLVGFVAVLCVVVFLLLGFFADLWSIAWLVFLIIPITAIIINIVKAAKKNEQDDDENID